LHHLFCCDKLVPVMKKVFSNLHHRHAHKTDNQVGCVCFKVIEIS
jgi:hypothetical protein